MKQKVMKMNDENVLIQEVRTGQVVSIDKDAWKNAQDFVNNPCSQDPYHFIGKKKDGNDYRCIITPGSSHEYMEVEAQEEKGQIHKAGRCDPRLRILDATDKVIPYVTAYNDKTKEAEMMIPHPGRGLSPGVVMVNSDNDAGIEPLVVSAVLEGSSLVRLCSDMNDKELLACFDSESTNDKIPTDSTSVDK